MFKKYPTEFEKIYERVVIDQEEIHKVIREYPEMIKKENMGVLNIVNYLIQYIDERNNLITD